MFFDSHAHLDRCQDITNPEHFFQHNLKGIVHISLNPQEFLENKPKLQHPSIYFATGYYPDHAALQDFNIDEALLTLKNVLTQYPHCALGEIGIDLKNDEYGSLECQQELFERQIHLASELNLPIIIHSRMSFQETFSSLKKHNISSIFHCFSYGIHEASKLLDLEGFISLAGLVTYPKSFELHEVAKYIPLDRLLLETDSPYLSPVPFRNKSNVPNNVQYIYHYIAELRKIPLEELCYIVQENFYKAFELK